MLTRNSPSVQFSRRLARKTLTVRGTYEQARRTVGGDVGAAAVKVAALHAPAGRSSRIFQDAERSLRLPAVHCISVGPSRRRLVFSRRLLAQPPSTATLHAVCFIVTYIVCIISPSSHVAFTESQPPVIANSPLSSA